MKTALLIPCFIIALLWSSPCTHCAGETQTLIGDHSDGSRALPVHVIPLLDEDGIEILPDDDPPMPFSVMQTCTAKCHSYETIKHGWHFSFKDDELARPGSPWIDINPDVGVQAPLLYRSDTINASRDFLRTFGRQLPGGGIGETWVEENPMRGMVSGKLDINCLACHDADPAHDQSEYAIQVSRENFRWAAGATSAFMSVAGSSLSMPDTYDYLMPEELTNPKLIPPTMTYKEGIFDHKNRVLFNIQRKIPNERCFFCHSTVHNVGNGNEKWMQEEDVHIAAGMLCVDCHRNGIDHNIVRGFEGESEHSDNPLADQMTCKGCHLDDGNDSPNAGHFAAPQPSHKGIPPIHLETMTCTACHSGTWPTKEVSRIKTSMAHGLGVRNANKSDDARPMIYAPVFKRNSQWKLAPYYLMWPSVWSSSAQEPFLNTISDNDIARAIKEASLKPEFDSSNMTQKSIAAILRSLQASQSIEAPIYLAGGQFYSLDSKGGLKVSEKQATNSYTWPLAHNVRPAAQSLGVRGCTDCHSPNAPFFFATVEFAAPFVDTQASVASMTTFTESSGLYTRLFGLSFFFRPILKSILALCFFALLLVAIAVLLKGTTTLLERNDK